MLRKVGLAIAWAWLVWVMISHIASLYPEAGTFVLKTRGLGAYRSRVCAHLEFEWCRTPSR